MDLVQYRYEAIAQQIAAQIIAKFYREGDRLPSVRTIMTTNGVSLTTASRALVELENMGYAEARPRSGFYVRIRRSEVPSATAPRPTATSQVPREVNVNSLITRLFKAAAASELLPLGAAELDEGLLPHKDLAAVLSRTARAHSAQAVAYSPPAGNPELRRRIALMMGHRGVVVSPNDVVVTAGASEAVGAALRAATRRGDTVAVESPTFFGILQWIERLGLKAVEIATDPRDGISVEELERVARATRIAAVTLNPTFHNPFGCAMPPERMQALADLAAELDLVVIEDDVYGELHFGAQPRRPLKAFDRTGAVIYCSSFSKTLAPGFRIGWCLPGRHGEAVSAVRVTQNYGNNSLSQLALADYLQGRKYGQHLKELRELFAAQRERVRGLVLDAFPAGTRISVPEGGYVFWIEAPPPFEAMRLYHEARAVGISIAPGPIFSPSGGFANAFRISVGRRLTPAVEQGIRRLGGLVGAQVG